MTVNKTAQINFIILISPPLPAQAASLAAPPLARQPALPKTMCGAGTNEPPWR
jgi:hypothetical protein